MKRRRYAAPSLTRRGFLAGGAATLLGPHLFVSAAPAAEAVAFFVIGDTHYLADKAAPDTIDSESAAVTSALIRVLNELPGSAIPPEAGGGKVTPPRGVIHAGDIIDTGDKSGAVHEAMQKTELKQFRADFGLTGGDGGLKYPVYEVHGNHDSPSGKGVAIDAIIERNANRPGVDHRCANGLHYAWNWGPIRLINLGIVVGQVKSVTQKRRYNPLESLDFLAADLKKNVGDTGRPVVITHHVDVARYTGSCHADDAANAQKEWNPCDVKGYYEALRGYNVIAIFYGHTHVRNVFQWDGASAKAASGINVFNVDNSSHFNSDTQSLFHVEAADGLLTVREYHTKDRWKSGQWTPQVWRRQVKLS
jgi:cytolysin (calcineurin-like family phosphatase)